MKKINLLLLGCLVSSIYAQNYLPQEISSIWRSQYNKENLSFFVQNNETSITQTIINAKGDSSFHFEKFDTLGLSTFRSLTKNGRTSLVSEHSYVYFDLPNDHKNPISFPSVTKTYRNGKLKFQFLKDFNALGRETKKTYFINGKEYRREETVYINDSIIQRETKYKKGKLTTFTTYQRNENNQLTAKQTFSHKNELIREIQYTYNTAGKTLRSTRYKNGKLDEYTVNTYDQEGKLLSYIIYDHKDQPKHVVNFECSPVGTYSKKVKQHNVCRYDAELDGYLIKTVEKKNEEGTYMKKVYKYRSSDTSLVNLSVYNRENEKYWNVDYDPDLKKVVHIEQFRKGKSISITHYTYLEGRLVEHKNIRKGKTHYLSKWKYDGDVLVETSRFNAKNELMYKKIIERTYYSQ